jgi:hypothetical protein
LEQWFGKWKGVMVSVLTSLFVVARALTLTDEVLFPVYED